jgi:hypothetical protein
VKDVRKYFYFEKNKTTLSLAALKKKAASIWGVPQGPGAIGLALAATPGQHITLS